MDDHDFVPPKKTVIIPLKCVGGLDCVGSIRILGPIWNLGWFEDFEMASVSLSLVVDTLVIGCLYRGGY